MSRSSTATSSPATCLSFENFVKLADFGLSRPMMATQGCRTTGQGRSIFAAPEVYRGRLTKDRTDQYALAVSYCLLRGGRLPFHNTVGRFTPSSRGQPDLSMLSPPERPIVAQAVLAVSSISSLDQLRRIRWTDFRICSPPRRKRRPWLPYPIVDALIPKSSFHDCAVLRTGNDRTEPAAIVPDAPRL